MHINSIEVCGGDLGDGHEGGMFNLETVSVTARLKSWSVYKYLNENISIDHVRKPDSS